MIIRSCAVAILTQAILAQDSSRVRRALCPALLRTMPKRSQSPSTTDVNPRPASCPAHFICSHCGSERSGSHDWYVLGPGAGINYGGTSKMWLCQTCVGVASADELRDGYYKWGGVDQLFPPESESMDCS